MKRVATQIGAYALAAAVILAIGWGGIHLWLGSWPAFVAYARGEGVSIEPSVLTLDLEPNSEHRFAFKVRNLRSESIKIVGARTGCTCVVNESLPCEIPASGSTELKGKVLIGEESGEFQQAVTFYADAGVVVELPVVIEGQISKGG